MHLKGKALRVIIYIGESDRYQGRPLHMALLHFLKQEGASGATVTRGLAGFGARSRIHTAAILALSEDLPLRLEWVDQQELVERLVPQVRKMVNAGLITIEEVDVIQYAPGRTADPLAQTVRDVMRKEVISVFPDTPVAEIVSMLIKRGYRSLPVVDEDGRLLGIITDGDLLRRGGLPARLDLQAELPKSELTEFDRRPETAADVMSLPVVNVTADNNLGKAMSQMVNHGLKRLPVVDNDDRLVGWISRVDILHNLEYHQPLPEQPLDKIPEGRNIADLMYKDVPIVSPEATLEEILQALEKNRRRRSVVVDDQRQVLGIITDGDLLRRTQLGEHPGFLARLKGLITGQPITTTISFPATETAASFMSVPVVTISLDSSLIEALSLMLKHKIKRLPVVDEDGRLVGLLGRASLLRGLLNHQS